MRTTQILDELTKYLQPADVECLRMNLAIPGSIVMCLAIARITKNYNASDKKEKEVSRLLSALCNKHFKTVCEN